MVPPTKPAQAQSAPSTPRKPRLAEKVIETIEQLNRDYNLAIEIPDVTLTPLKISSRAKHDAAFARSDKIVRGIRYHCFRTTLLDNILHSFRMEARAASQKWIRLSDCYDESSPATPEPPKAASPGEVLDLQERLISVLERAGPKVGVRTFARAQSGPAVSASVETPKSKRRHLHDNKRDSPKRAKASPPEGQDVEEVIADTLDKVPSRSRPAKPELLSAQFARSPGEAKRRNFRSNVPPNVPPAPKESFYGNPSVATSATTSRASIFSVAQGPLPSTQDTVPATSLEAKGGAPLLSQEPSSSQSQDFFPASAGHLDALNVSFTEHEAETSSRLYTKPPGYTPPPGGSSPSLTTIYSEVSGIDDSALYQPISSPLKRSEPVTLPSRLDATWPRFPPWLNRAPFAVAWEITRIALHCNVDLGEVVMSYDEAWINYNNLWKTLQSHPSFAGKAFPERPTNDAWTAGLSGFQSPRGQHVTFTACLAQRNNTNSGPIFSLTMNPIALDQGCRLHRQFGSDRFLELVIPSPNRWKKPFSAPDVSQEIIRWLTSRLHYFAGRQWRVFYAKDAGHKKPQTNVSLGPDPKPIYKERLRLFAENGNSFQSALPLGASPLDNLRGLKVKLGVREMLDWLLQLDSNESQPYLKLFARIQLGLSKTTPVVVLDPSQIRHRDADMMSPIGKVMNDGIGLMSRSLASKIKHVLGLSDVPSAIQGRFGSAKGMWLIDIEDSDDDLWIETWPSQRKWNCDFSHANHRTLEVQAHAVEPRSASLNVQFLPVLEDRAIDKPAMRQAIGDCLVDELNRELEAQKSAMKDPVQFRQWINENWPSRTQRLVNNRVPFLGGIPDSSEETMSFLIDGGFEPSKQKYLQEIAWKLRRTKCENLKKKMSIKIPNSAYLFMVVDFWGILEENEVHLGFSSKFQTDSFSDSMLHACDVLVARSPAHFVSDIQRVKAVFKPKLHALKDVIVFSAKGNVPLADKLSGGDYDGDKAWVCWEPAIVSNFKNQDVPPSPDLSKYLRKDKTAYEELVRQYGKVGAVSEMIDRSISFGMRQSYLGIATNYKERLCYQVNSVNNKYALYLSTLLGNLVDQSKQGFEFTADDWKRFCRELLDGDKFRNLDDPAYKSESWSSGGNPAHIIDYLKFKVAKPTIEKELERFHRAMNPKSVGGRELKSLQLSRGDDEDQTAEYFDSVLVKPHNEFRKLVSTRPVFNQVLRNLGEDLRALKDRWSKSVASANDNDDLPRRMLEVYEVWRAIEPRADEELSPLETTHLKQSYANEDHTTWALIRASTLFKYYVNLNATFVWRMAGIQLQFIKSMTTASRDCIPVTVAPHIYAALKPDAKYVAQAVSRMKDGGSEYPGLDSDGEEFVDDD